MKQRIGISLLAAGAMLAGLLAAAPAEAGVRVYVRVAPPPLIVEARPVSPGPGYVWVAGFHRWTGRAYVWVLGHWERPPRRRAVWVPGHWRHARRGWFWVGGRWR